MIITKSYSHSPKITINVHDDHHQAKRVKVVTRLKDFSGRRRPVSCPSYIIVTTIMTRVVESKSLKVGKSLKIGFDF